MKLKYIIGIVLGIMIQSCALDEPDLRVESESFPFRLQMDEEGSDLADAEDYKINIGFADYLGDLPASEIVLTYELSGEGDFSNVALDEVIYEFEDDDCVFIRAVSFTPNTLTIPVDPDMGHVPEEIELVFAYNLSNETALEGGFEFVITSVSTVAPVIFNAINTFEYQILDNEVAGGWEIEFENEAQFEAFQAVFGLISKDLADISFAEIDGKAVFEFGFEEMKIEIELIETEEVEACEDGEITVETENLVIEIEADYDAEDGELVLEGSYFNEDEEELDFEFSAVFENDAEGNLVLTIEKIIGEDNYEEGDEVFSGSVTFTLIKGQ